MKLIERQKGRIQLRLQFIRMGADACLILTGGDRPHLGAAAVAQSRESLAVPGKPSSTVSNITLLGHKDDVLAREIARRFSEATATNVVVCCGIHLDSISTEEIEEILAISSDILEEMVNVVKPQ